MSYLDDFKARMNLNGNSIAESQFNTTANFIISHFADDPSYRVANWNGQDIEIRLMDFLSVSRTGNTTNSILYNLKFALFKPNVVMDMGEVLVIDNNSWLIVDILSENKLFPKAEIRLCNSLYPIKTNETRVLLKDANGNPILDKFGDPVYQIVEGTITNVPCIVESVNSLGNENVQLPLLDGRLRVIMKYRDDIKVNDTFTMYSNIYKIRTIDYTKVINNVGTMSLFVEQVTSEVK